MTSTRASDCARVTSFASLDTNASASYTRTMAYAYPSFTPLEGAAAELKKLDAKDVLRAFRLRGIAGTLQADAVDGIVRQLRREPDKHGALDKIFNALQEYLVRNPSACETGQSTAAHESLVAAVNGCRLHNRCLQASMA